MTISNMYILTNTSYEKRFERKTMGLAASQARLLTITARKTDCEFLSMTLSHQKLSLSRDMEKVSNDYQNALSQTKLVYDYYGSGDTSINLDYGLLMTPSIYNDYYPKTVTDSKNRVILNSALSAAARAAGIPVEGLAGTPSDNVRNSFIGALAGAGVITPAKAAAIESVTYGNTIGLGNTKNVSYGFVNLTYDELIDQIEAVTGNETTYDAGLNFQLTEKEMEQWEITGLSGNEMGIRLYDKDGNRKDWYNGDSGQVTISLSDLLKNDTQYVWAIQECRGGAKSVTSAAYIQRTICGTDDGNGSFVDYLVDMFGSVLGGVAANETALQYAANAVYDIVYPNSDLQELVKGIDGEYYDNDRKHHDKSANGEDRDDWNDILEATSAKVVHKWGKNDRERVTDPAVGCIGMVTSVCDDAGNGGQYHYSGINLNALAQVFLTAFVEYQEGIDESQYNYARGLREESSLYDPKHSDFKFTVAAQTSVDSDDDNLYANFYDALFNQICMNGWTENDQIEDVEYMTDLFKNGLAFISSIAEDGFYYQGSYTTDRAILEVADENAIAVAEAKYNTEKAKIESKENTIDLKVKNLDTEISSLTTEYDTTKQIITKSIEKSFKRYDA